MKLRGLYLLAIPLLLSSCAGPQRSARAAGEDTSEDAAIASALKSIKAKESDYRITAADLLEITIYQNPDLDRKIRVSHNGTIAFPLVGTVSLGGLTVIDAGNLLSSKLRDNLVDPQVTVFIKEYGNKQVYVFGQVTKPGSYELPTESNLTVVQAISMAGGFTPIAAPDRTKVIRSSNGQSQTFLVEVSAVTRHGLKEKDLPLLPNDVIYVPKSFF